MTPRLGALALVGLARPCETEVRRAKDHAAEIPVPTDHKRKRLSAAALDLDIPWLESLGWRL